MTKIIEYDGPILIIKRYAQELLDYMFTVVHRSSKMVIDVDSLIKQFGTLIATHCVIAIILRDRGIIKRPFAYDKPFSTSPLHLYCLRM